MHEIAPAKATDSDVAALLGKHFDLMRAQSPPESCHVLPADQLAGDDIHLFALRGEGRLLAVGAIRVYGAWGELKSMHTDQAVRGQGLGSVMLQELIKQARQFGLRSLKLETGSGPEHEPARRLYQSAGFVTCAPFGDYSADPLSMFMSRAI